MCTPPLRPTPRPASETASVGAEAVLLEWLAAVRGVALQGPAALQAWAQRDSTGFRAEFAAFARIDPGVAAAAAGWLLGAGVRPDDRVLWTGNPADPCLAGLAAIGGRRTDLPAQATIVRDLPPVWPPPAVQLPVRPPVSDRDGP